MADSSTAAVHHTGHPDVTKRDFLKLITGASAAIGTAAVAWAFIDYMNPSADVLAFVASDAEERMEFSSMKGTESSISESKRSAMPFIVMRK